MIYADIFLKALGQKVAWHGQLDLRLSLLLFGPIANTPAFYLKIIQNQHSKIIEIVSH